jgi:hypothetical protein
MRECDEGQDIDIEGKKEHDKPRRTFSERLIGCRLKRVHEDVRGRERRKHVKLSGGWLADIEPGGTQDTQSYACYAIYPCTDHATRSANLCVPESMSRFQLLIIQDQGSLLPRWLPVNIFLVPKLALLSWVTF